ncbi:MAG: DUF456 domain-containing protein [Calditrichia bacterium]
MAEIVLNIFLILLMGIGLILTVLPVLQGLPVMLVIYIAYGIFTRWSEYSLNSAIIFLGLTVFTYFFDYLATVAGAKKMGASKQGIIGSVIGLIFGVIVFNVPGILIGPFLGAMIAELLIGRSASEAVRSGWGTLIGFLASSLVKIIVGLFYFIYFAIKIF